MRDDDKTDPAWYPGLVDRRREERIPARIEVHFRDAADAARVLKAYSRNVSVGGICIKSRRRYDVGTSLLLSMDIAGDRYDLRGSVAWVRDGAVGVRFVGLTSEVRQRLERVVAVLKRR